MGYVERISSPAALWPGNQPLLSWLDVELTHRCNNKCMHCCVNLPAADKTALENESSTGDLCRILREAADLGTLQVRMTGGEPLLRPDFRELYLYARKLGMRVLIFTNGRLITPDLADLFIRVPPLVPIEITVFGMHRRSYESVSGVQGSFAEFRTGLDLLLERDVPFVVKGVLLPPNRTERQEFDAWAAGLPWMDGPPGYVTVFEKRSRRDDPVKDLQILRLQPSPEEVPGAILGNESIRRNGLAEFCRRFLHPPGEALFACGAGKGGCVDPYGHLQACLGLRTPELAYSLKRGKLKEAFISHFPRLRELRASNPEYLRRCGICFLKALCGQCPAKSWNETGTLDSPVEYLCSVAHSEARRLRMIDQGELAWEVRDWRFRIERAFPH